MSDDQISLAETANKRQLLRYKMVVESTSIDTIRDAMPMFLNAIIISTPHGYLLAVPEPDDPDDH